MKRRAFLRFAGAALLAGFVNVRIPELVADGIEFETTDIPGWEPPSTLHELMHEVFESDIVESVVRGPFPVPSMGRAGGVYFETSSAYISRNTRGTSPNAIIVRD